jgi:hypothetical protein
MTIVPPIPNAARDLVVTEEEARPKPDGQGRFTGVALKRQIQMIRRDAPKPEPEPILTGRSQPLKPVAEAEPTEVLNRILARVDELAGRIEALEAKP